jgi:hypothetical protein
MNTKLLLFFPFKAELPLFLGKAMVESLDFFPWKGFERALLPSQSFEVEVILCGQGKVRAAMALQAAFYESLMGKTIPEIWEKQNIRAVLLGTAGGGFLEETKPVPETDILLPEECLETDFGNKKPGAKVPRFEYSPAFRDKLRVELKNAGVNVSEGRILSGDRDVFDSAERVGQMTAWQGSAFSWESAGFCRAGQSLLQNPNPKEPTPKNRSILNLEYEFEFAELRMVIDRGDMAGKKGKNFPRLFGEFSEKYRDALQQVFLSLGAL